MERIFIILLLIFPLIRGYGDLVFVGKSGQDEDGEAVVEIDSDQQHQPSDEIFVATEEWKEIKAGQSVPAGLHYRVNMQTGKREAKLLSPEDAKKRKNRADSLKKIDDGGGNSTSKEEEETKFRSYQELQDEIARSKIKLNTEFEAVNTLVETYHNSTDKLSVLEDLDYYLHQYDNARDFVLIQGMEKIVKPALNDMENPEIRQKSSILFSSCVQSHPDVQERMLNSGWMDFLTRKLDSEPDSLTKIRILGSISALIRGHSRSLQTFLKSDGVKLVTRNFLTATKGYSKSTLRAVIFLSDLFRFRPENDTTAVADHFDRESKTQICPSLSQSLKAEAEFSLDLIEKVSQILASDLARKVCAEFLAGETSLISNWISESRTTLERIEKNDPEFEVKHQLDILNSIEPNVENNSKLEL